MTEATNLEETEVWEEGIYALKRTDYVDAGVDGGGLANLQPKQLGNRTKFLRGRVIGDDTAIYINDVHDVTDAEMVTGVFDIQASIPIGAGGSTLRVQDPAAGKARVRIIRNSTANDVTITTVIGSSTHTLKAATVRSYLFLRTGDTATLVIPLQVMTDDVDARIVAKLAAHPTIDNPDVSGGTIDGAAITSGTIGGCALAGSTISGLTLDSPTMAGTPVITATSMQATGDAKLKIYSAIGKVSTTDATPTNAFTWTIKDVAVTMVMLQVTALKSDASASAIFNRVVKIHRSGSTVTVTPVSDGDKPDAALDLCEVNVDNSTTTARVRVTGLASTNITFGFSITRQEQTA